MSLNESLIILLIVDLGLLVIAWFVHITATQPTATDAQKLHIWHLNQAAYTGYVYVGGHIKQSDRPMGLGGLVTILLLMSTLFYLFYALVLAH